ncbi:MAG: MBOAT family O-acyltransferase [Eubacteriales bacterium]|nr:MBOAT family O-acyltransferase [Eubacteriales bacterium]
MSFAVIGYFAFLLIGLVIYYLIPRKFSWIWLLMLSYIYYFTFNIRTSLYMVSTTMFIYFGGLALDKVIIKGNTYLKDHKEQLSKEEKKAYKERLKRNKRLVLTAIILLCFGQLAVVKYSGFALENINSIIAMFGGKKQFNVVEFALPLGISFFTFQSVSYIVDVYQEKYRCQRNPFKLGLFVSFFPQLLQGPIGRYDRLSGQLYEGNRFELKNIEFGLQRIIWGLAKKVVLADRAAVVVNEVFGNYDQYGGLFNILAVLMYSVQLYMDFSGGIDIVIGTAQMFGIKMDENFRQPYFSKSIGDFWRRWHITLGTWMKDYIFYPLSLSKAMNKFSKWGRKHIGTFIGRTLPICFADIVIFFVVGIWHGASWKYIAYGLYNGFIMAFSALMGPVYKKLEAKCHINVNSRGWKVWQMIRTFILVNIGWYFDMAGSFTIALIMMKYSIVSFSTSVLTDGSLLRLGIGTRDYWIILVGCIIVFIISVLKEKGVSIRESIAKKNIVIRWGIWYALILLIIVFGYTGGVQAFLYANF